MRRRDTMWGLAALALSGLVFAACSSGGGGGMVISTPTVNFSTSGTPSSPDLVRLTGETSADEVSVDVVVAGPTTSDDLYSFAFDLVISDPSVLEFVAGSAMLGPALTLSGGQQSQALAVQSGDRVVVGVSKLGGGSGNPVASGEPVIVTLRFRAVGPGVSTLDLQGAPPDDPVALDSAGAPIASIHFDTVPVTVSAN